MGIAVNEKTLSADYVIAGAGAVGLAFADTLLRDSDASLIIVDRHARPGGHWNDAYPFVRLHGPSTTYGVDSLRLGSGRIEEGGLNQGLQELASWPEICAYFDRVMDELLLASGRVTYLPLHHLEADGCAISLRDGSRWRLQARRRWVDATQAQTQVPATHAPRFAVAAGMQCLTPGELARSNPRGNERVIIGGGKTAMDTVLWLLAQGVEPDSITWIRPREAWLLNRANVQASLPFAEDTLTAITAEFEAARDATSLDDLFARLEWAGLLQRIDTAVQPTMYRCAIVSEAELAQLRRVRNVVRRGHVLSIESDRIVLERGEVPTSPARIHVHCSAAGLPRGPAQAVFQGSRIVPQYLRRCSPCFSAALIAHIEAGVDGDDDAKNALCTPVPVPEVPLDWLRMHLLGARNQQRWSRHPELSGWLRHSRLEAYSGLFAQAAQTVGPKWMALLTRLNEARGPGLERMAELLAFASITDDTARKPGLARGHERAPAHCG